MLNLRNLFKCQICWQISWVIFAAILALEAVILVPSYLNYKSTLIEENNIVTRLKFTNFILRKGLGVNLHKELENDLSNHKIISYSVFDQENSLTDAWRSKNNTKALAQSLKWSFSLQGLPYHATVTVNKADINKRVERYLLRVGALVLFISLFTTFIAIVILQRRVLMPITMMNTWIETISDNIYQTGIFNPLSSLKTYFYEDNELGQLFSSFKKLLVKKNDLLISLEENKEELKKLNQNLEIDIQKRTKALITKNSELISVLDKQHLAQEKIASIALFPEENANPVLRFTKEGILLYANRASAPLLKVWALSTSERLEGRWRSVFIKIMVSGRQRKIILKFDKRFLKLLIVPIQSQSYANIYIEDITKEKINEQRAKLLAFYDPYTGLPNKALFLDWLDILDQEEHSFESQYVILMLNLKNYSIIHKAFGSQTSDRILKFLKFKTQKELQVLTRSNSEGEVYKISACLARLGTHEFAILLRRSNEKKGQQLADKLISSFESPVSVMGQSIALTLTIGVASFPFQGVTTKDVYSNAELALITLDTNHKSEVQCFNKAIGDIHNRKKHLLNDLRHAIKNKELEIYFQAKVSTLHNVIQGSEALLRWHHPILGFISPVEFIPIAEDNDLMQEIGSWVMEQSIIEQLKFQAAGYKHLKVSINLSVQQFQDEDLVDHISEVLNRTGIDPSTIELEITESMLMETGQYTIEMLNRLKTLGIQLAIDDFGTGYSSLAYLNRFPIDTLKIDRAFIINLASSKEDQAIVQAILNLAKSLSLTVVAEGVETEQQLDLLTCWGCDLIQGYFYSKPVDAVKFLDLIKVFNNVPNQSLN